MRSILDYNKCTLTRVQVWQEAGWPGVFASLVVCITENLPESSLKSAYPRTNRCPNDGLSLKVADSRTTEQSIPVSVSTTTKFRSRKQSFYAPSPERLDPKTKKNGRDRSKRHLVRIIIESLLSIRSWSDCSVFAYIHLHFPAVQVKIEPIGISCRSLDVVRIIV